MIPSFRIRSVDCATPHLARAKRGGGGGKEPTAFENGRCRELIRRTHRALSEGLLDKWPVTILVNQGSGPRKDQEGRPRHAFDSSFRRETNNPLNRPAFLETIERLSRRAFRFFFLTENKKEPIALKTIQD